MTHEDVVGCVCGVGYLVPLWCVRVRALSNRALPTTLILFDPRPHDGRSESPHRSRPLPRACGPPGHEALTVNLLAKEAKVIVVVILREVAPGGAMLPTGARTAEGAASGEQRARHRADRKVAIGSLP